MNVEYKRDRQMLEEYSECLHKIIKKNLYYAISSDFKAILEKELENAKTMIGKSTSYANKAKAKARYTLSDVEFIKRIIYNAPGQRVTIFAIINFLNKKTISEEWKHGQVKTRYIIQNMLNENILYKENIDGMTWIKVVE